MMAKPSGDAVMPDAGHLHCANTAITAMQPGLRLKKLDQAAHAMIGEASEGLSQQSASEVSIEATSGEFILTT